MLQFACIQLYSMKTRSGAIIITTLRYFATNQFVDKKIVISI